VKQPSAHFHDDTGWPPYELHDDPDNWEDEADEPTERDLDERISVDSNL